MPLGEVSVIKLGKMLDRNQKEGVLYPYLRNINVRWGTIDTSDLLTMPFKERELEIFAIRDDDVLVCEGGEPGRSAVWRHGPTQIKYQKALHRVRLSGGVRPDWLVYQLELDAATGALAGSFTGSTIAHLPLERLRDYSLRLAPTGEQDRVIDALESHLSRLDDAVASLERAQARLKAYRASVLKAAVEGRLVPTEAELARAEKRGYEPADVLLERILAERRRRWEKVELGKLKAARKAPKDDKWKARYVQPTPPTLSGLPELPTGWGWATVDQIAQCLDHLRVPVSKKERQKRQGVVPYYGANGRTGWIDKPLFDETLVLVVEDETFTGRIKPFSYLISGPAWVNNHAHILRAVGSMSPEFLNTVLAHYPFIPLTTGTTGRRKLTKKALMAAPVAVPPLEEQERITDSVSALLSVSDGIASSLDDHLKRIARLRQSLLKWAFEGKLVDQDLNDEPADVLLARIRTDLLAPLPNDRPRRRRVKAAR